MPDSLNYVRKARPQNMLHAWSIPSDGGVPYSDFPELPSNDLWTPKRVNWWNTKLAEQAPDAGLKVVACGSTDIKLNEKPGLLGL